MFYARKCPKQLLRNKIQINIKFCYKYRYIIIMSEENKYVEVEDGQEVNNQVQETEEQLHQQKEQLKPETETVMKESEHPEFDHQEIGLYANVSLDVEDEMEQDIKLKIIGTDQKGSTFTKYTVYIIKGHDKNGQIDVCRRFNEFHELRVALVRRWPGCFIPSIPSKNYVKKNDPDMVQKRERFLNDFLRKMTKLNHLYSSEEFQTFLRSKETDVSKVYSSWSNPSIQSLINKYRDSFNNLEGKTINSVTEEHIVHFYALINKNQALLEKYRTQAKQLALARDKYNNLFPRMMNIIIPNYEKNCLLEYSNHKQQRLVYLNGDAAKLSEHGRMAEQVSKRNPYWLVYDMIKHEERDGKALLEAFVTKDEIEKKRQEMDAKIRNHEKQVIEIVQGKKSSSKVNLEEHRYKLESELEEFKKEKNNLLMLTDIIAALLVYIELEEYKKNKVRFYHEMWRRIGGFEINSVQIKAEIWSGAKEFAAGLYEQGKSFY